MVSQISVRQSPQHANGSTHAGSGATWRLRIDIRDGDTARGAEKVHVFVEAADRRGEEVAVETLQSLTGPRLAHST